MNPGSAKILLVDDDRDILEFVSYNLVKEGFRVATCLGGKEALEIAGREKPHLILLDVMMPEVDGIETCEKIRNLPGLENTLIVFLTARGEDYSQIAGFEAGGDDYIVKPIKPKVLVSRVKALLKRYSSPETGVDTENELIRIDGLVLDRSKYLVYRDEKEIFLPRKEFELLALLLSSPGRVYTREEIFKKVWGEGVIVGERTIDVHVRKLREKIGDQMIRTIKGVGYKFSGRG